MDGALIPDDLFIQAPWWINLFENVKTVQFVHRVGAYVLFALALIHWIKMIGVKPSVRSDSRAGILFGLIALQAVFGIVTLLTQVHLHIALVHQGMALIVLGFAVAHLRGFVGAYPYQGKA
jgi:cytochrome c oxidase assembly protein subunit 15